MKQYLYTALTCFLIAAIASLFISCVPAWQSSCGHNSATAIMVVGPEYPTRLIIGFISEKDKKDGKAHVQAEYFRDGKWRPLQVYYWPDIVEGEHEFELIDTHYMSGKDVLRKYTKMIK